MLVFLLHKKAFLDTWLKSQSAKLPSKCSSWAQRTVPELSLSIHSEECMGNTRHLGSEHNSKCQPHQQGWKNLFPDWLLIPNCLAKVWSMQCREVIFCGIHSIYLHYTPGSHAIKQQLHWVNKVNLIKLLPLPLFQLARFRAQGHSAVCK